MELSAESFSLTSSEFKSHLINTANSSADKFQFVVDTCVDQRETIIRLQLEVARLSSKKSPVSSSRSKTSTFTICKEDGEPESKRKRGSSCSKGISKGEEKDLKSQLGVSAEDECIPFRDIPIVWCKGYERSNNVGFDINYRITNINTAEYYSNLFLVVLDDGTISVRVFGVTKHERDKTLTSLAKNYLNVTTWVDLIRRGDETNGCGIAYHMASSAKSPIIQWKAIIVLSIKTTGVASAQIALNVKRMIRYILKDLNIDALNTIHSYSLLPPAEFNPLIDMLVRDIKYAKSQLGKKLDSKIIIETIHKADPPSNYIQSKNAKAPITKPKIRKSRFEGAQQKWMDNFYASVDKSDPFSSKKVKSAMASGVLGNMKKTQVYGYLGKLRKRDGIRVYSYRAGEWKEPLSSICIDWTSMEEILDKLRENHKELCDSKPADKLKNIVRNYILNNIDKRSRMFEKDNIDGTVFYRVIPKDE